MVTISTYASGGGLIIYQAYGNLYAMTSLPLVAQTDYAFLNKISEHATEPLSESTVTPTSKSLESSANVDLTTSVVASERNEEMVNAEVDGIWKTFGGNTRDLDSIWEENRQAASSPAAEEGTKPSPFSPMERAITTSLGPEEARLDLPPPTPQYPQKRQKYPAQKHVQT
nr:hypothetical protein [Tanacetum cinerariifolium]